MLNVGAGVNLCRACGEDFGSVSAFDVHRVGVHAYLFSPERPDGRRCLSTPEMLARGFLPNSRGRWSTSVHLTAPAREAA
jgi:hypothetical protein